MSLNDLYQEIILEHGKKPRNFGPLEGKTNEAEGTNPLCGDEVHVELVVRDDRIADIRFTGSGCAISTASASMMTEAVRGKTKQEAAQLMEKLVHAVTHDGDIPEEFGEMKALEGVKQFPTRVKCATLSWHALEAALNSESEKPKVTSE